MSMDYLANAVANRMINAANRRQIKVYEDGFVSEELAFESEDPKAVAAFLKEHGAYKGAVTMDGGYFVEFPDRSSLRQGQRALDQWIESHS